MKTFLAALAAGAALIAGATAATAATTAPKITKAAPLSAKLIHTAKGDYYSLGTVVRLDRALTQADKQHQRYGLIAGRWATRKHLADGVHLPDQLLGGTSLGTIGKASKHCYLAEVAQLQVHKTVKFGAPWRLALHDGNHVLGTGVKVTLVRQTAGDESGAAKSLGCL